MWHDGRQCSPKKPGTWSALYVQQKMHGGWPSISWIALLSAPRMMRYACACAHAGGSSSERIVLVILVSRIPGPRTVKIS